MKYVDLSTTYVPFVHEQIKGIVNFKKISHLEFNFATSEFYLSCSLFITENCLKFGRKNPIFLGFVSSIFTGVET